MNRQKAADLTRLDNPFRYFMPYCYQRINTGDFEHVYMPTNREYLPIGCMTEDWGVLEDYLDRAVVFSSDPHNFKDVWYNRERLYLYGDSVESRETYLERFDKLLSHPMRVYPIARRDWNKVNGSRHLGLRHDYRSFEPVNFPTRVDLLRPITDGR